MIKLILRFWHVFIPVIAYGFWKFIATRRVDTEDSVDERVLRGPVFWVIFSTIMLMFISLVWLALHQEPTKGNYVPPKVEDGIIVPGHLEQ